MAYFKTYTNLPRLTRAHFPKTPHLLRGVLLGLPFSGNCPQEPNIKTLSLGTTNLQQGQLSQPPSYNRSYSAETAKASKRQELLRLLGALLPSVRLNKWKSESRASFSVNNWTTSGQSSVLEKRGFLTSSALNLPHAAKRCMFSYVFLTKKKNSSGQTARISEPPNASLVFPEDLFLGREAVEQKERLR